MDFHYVGNNQTCLYSKFIMDYCKIADIKKIIFSPNKMISLDENYRYFKFSVKKMIRLFKFKKFTDNNDALKKIFQHQRKLFFSK